MDEAIGNVTNAMRVAGMWDNTLLVFSTGITHGITPHINLLIYSSRSS